MKAKGGSQLVFNINGDDKVEVAICMSGDGNWVVLRLSPEDAEELGAAILDWARDVQGLE